MTAQTRLRPADRRRQIVAAARDVLVRQGLGATSLRDIAREAEVSMGTVTYHFAGVDEILDAVIVGETDRFYHDVVAAADAEADPWQALARLAEPLFVDSADVDEHWRLWTDYWAASARHPDLAPRLAGRIRQWEACCARAIERGIAAGAFAPVDPRTAALKLASYCDGLGMQRAQGADGLTAAIARQWMAEFARLLLTP